MKKLKVKIKKTLSLCFQPYMRILPGNVAYSLMMSIVPILSIIVMICSSLNLSTNILFDRLGDIIPSNVLTMLLEYLTSNTIGNVILIIAGIWAASMGPNALIISSNLIYKYENSNYLQRRIKALILTVLVILVIIINLVVLVFGNTLLTFIFDLFGLSTIVLEIFKFIKWPIALILIYFIIKILYTACPDKGIKSKTVTKGAIFTTVVWLLSSALYSYYVNNFANYTRVYGGLANIIVLMIWLYILSYILVVGMAINYSEYNEINE